VAALERVDLHGTHAVVEEIALERINGFCRLGRADVTADEYATTYIFGLGRF